MTELDALIDGETSSDPEVQNRHLKSTLAALRLALENADAERNALPQKVRAAYEGQIAELQAPIVALRAALEESRQEGQAAVERAVANSADEIAQLRRSAQCRRERRARHA